MSNPVERASRVTGPQVAKVFILGLLLAGLSLGIFSLGTGAQGAGTVTDKLRQVEVYLYGREQAGALLERITQVEKDIFGAPQQGSVIERVERAADFAGDTPLAGPSLLFKLKAVEWSILRTQGSEPLMAKIDKLEKLVTGKTGQGSVAARVDALVKLCIPGGAVQARTVVVPAGTAMRIKFLSGVNSGTAKKGDKVEFEVVRDVIIGTELIVPRGTRGVATVSSVTPAGKLGRDGKLELEIKEVKAIDGSVLLLGLDEKTSKLNESLQLAVGASVAGYIIFGPIGVLGGLFIQGKDADIPAGTEMYVATSKDAQVLGLSFPGTDAGDTSSPSLPAVRITPST
ncbi:MAG TPA: hypothetical protein GXX51_07670 [Firmicutes bacterium]|nr:hypothetical protein [Bacillota bacterium]